MYTCGSEVTVGILNVYGKNVVSTEGAEWRLHRKVTTRPFSEKNNQLVHEETLRQTTRMMAIWKEQSESNGTYILKRSST